MVEDIVKSRKERIVTWLKKPTNILLILILLMAFGIRLYYFNLASGQALWWDEAEYMATAKHWIMGVPYIINAQRPPLFQLFEAIAFMMGLGEQFIKFVFTMLPSVFLVFAIYLLAKEMKNEKAGLIAGLLAAVSWTFVFWSSRIQPDFLSMSFQVMAVWAMWKHWKSPNSKFIIASGILSALGFYFKVSALLVPMIFFVFMLIRERGSMFTNKYNYMYAASFLLTLAPYFAWSYLTFKDVFAFRAGYVNAPTDFPIGWYNLQWYKLITDGITFWLFLIGVILSLRVFLYIDVLIKDKKQMLDYRIFSLLAMAFISAFYIFYMRNTDDRWVFLWLPFIFIMVSEALETGFDLIKKYSKFIAFVVILGLLAYASYEQVNHADQLVKIKKDSYMPVKLGGIWIKEHSQPTDLVLSVSYTQTVYYSERNTSQLNDLQNASQLDEFLKENKPRFLMISVFEPHNKYIYDWVQQNQNRLQVVDAYFADKSQQQALLIVYEIKY